MGENDIDWTRETTNAAAAKVNRLSALLKQDRFCRVGALKLLEPECFDKFVSILDAEEARNLRRFAYGWHFTDKSGSYGMPLLRNLFDSVSNRREMVGRLALFEPDWVAQWIKWEIKDSRYVRQLYRSEDRKQWLFDLEDNLLNLLRENKTLADPISVIDAVIFLSEEDKVIGRLNDIVKKWNGNAGDDPISFAVKRGHQDICRLLKHPWEKCRIPSKNNSYWEDGLGWHVNHAIRVAVYAAPRLFRLELGFSCGVRIAKEQNAPSIETLNAVLVEMEFSPTAELLQEILPTAALWATLRKFAEYEKNSWQHETELIGLRATVTKLVAESPQLWADSLDWILVRYSEIRKLVDVITIEFSIKSNEVRTALKSACSSEIEDVRLKAHGLWTLLNGIEGADSELAGILADAAARYMDGTPMFPHPLAPMSATWLGSDGVEGVLKDGIRRAADRFASEAREQWGDIEEALVKGLVKEIEFEFRNALPKLKVIGKNLGHSHPPMLTVAQRPASKMLEEPIYGCDLAWLIRGSVRGRFSATWADVVQVKKSNVRGVKTAKSESWKIDSKQLDNILNWSASATYWLLCSSGEILVIPAKYLLSIRNGTGKTGKCQSFTIGYWEVRSASIPLGQYLVDLLIGQWLGSTSDEMVKFAQGGNINIRPRVIVEVTISINSEMRIHDNSNG